MKKLFSLVAVAGFVAASQAGAEDFGFDKAHTHIGFSVKHILSQVPGEFKDYDGSFSFDPKDPSKDKVNVTIQVASISTDNDMRDHHLQSPDFFDVEKYPTLTFKSTQVTAATGDKYQVAGDLTLHGVTKPVTLDVQYEGSDKMMGADVVGFSATTTIDRRDFGLTWGQDKLTAAGNLMVANEVNITLDVAGMDKASLAKMAAMMKAKPAATPGATPAAAASK
ncbi:MAG TPA: YceI family protein [bacterium]|nr:YceI family protein [bacterium]